MKTALCYGDSNTWGWDPATTNRYPVSVRWPEVMATELGDGWRVISEGLNGRTTVLDDPVEQFKNGRMYLIPCLESHKPTDLVVVMLGTNDLKQRFNFAAFDIAEGVGCLVDIVKSSCCGVGNAAPKVLVVSPPPILEVAPYSEMFRGGREKSLHFKSEFARMAAERNVPVLFTEEIVSSSKVDGIHLMPEGHRAIGIAVAQEAKLLLSH